MLIFAANLLPITEKALRYERYFRLHRLLPLKSAVNNFSPTND